MHTLPRRGSVSVLSEATPEAVWAVVSDITRVGEWSHECKGGVWVDGATGAVPGARFQGRNTVGRAGWTRSNEIVTADAPREIAWRTISTWLYNDSTEWRITIEPVDGGTRITQSFRVLKLGPISDRLFALIVPKHRDRSAALEGDMQRLGEVAASNAAKGVRSP